MNCIGLMWTLSFILFGCMCVYMIKFVSSIFIGDILRIYQLMIMIYFSLLSTIFIKYIKYHFDLK